MAKKGRIAFVVQRYGKEVNGGAELHCMQVAERLAPLYDVEVITTCAVDYMTWKNAYDPGFHEINGIRVHRFPVDHPRDVPKFNMQSQKVFEGIHTVEDELDWMKMQGPYSSGLLKFLQESRYNYDFFIFFTYLYCTTFFGLPLVKDRALLVPTAHDEPPIRLGIYKEIFKTPRAIVYNTREEQLMVERLFRNGHILNDIVGVGVDEPADIDPVRFRVKYGVYGDFIVYVGRIDRSKGCDMLFDYFRRYKAETGSQIKLVLCGKEVIPVPKSRDIKRLGFITDGDKIDAIAASSLLVLPSKYESLSMVMLEAWACGKPSLVNGECAVLKAQSRRSDGSLWFESYDEFKAGLDLLLSNKSLSCRLGENGAAFVKKHYAWPAIVDKYVRIMDRLSAQDDGYSTETLMPGRPVITKSAQARPSTTGHNVSE